MKNIQRLKEVFQWNSDTGAYQKIKQEQEQKKGRNSKLKSKTTSRLLEIDLNSFSKTVLFDHKKTHR